MNGLLETGVGKRKTKGRPTAAEGPFDAAELRALLAACLADRKLHPLAVCAAVGCRIGEALALEPGDYDPAAGALTIARTVVIRTGGVGPPKSSNSARTIAGVPAALAPALARPPDTRRYRTHLSRWAAVLARLGLPYRNIHALRHSVISHAIAAGVPIANVARDAGDSVQTVVRTYCRPVPGRGIGAAMADLYGAAGGTLGGARVARPAPKRKQSGPNARNK